MSNYKNHNCNMKTRNPTMTPQCSLPNPQSFNSKLDYKLQIGNPNWNTQCSFTKPMQSFNPKPKLYNKKKIHPTTYLTHIYQATLKPHKPFTLLCNFKKFKVVHILPLLIIEALYALGFGYLHIQQITKWNNLPLGLVHLQPTNWNNKKPNPNYN
jgi:hypothetical protein